MTVVWQSCAAALILYVVYIAASDYIYIYIAECIDRPSVINIYHAWLFASSCARIVVYSRDCQKFCKNPNKMKILKLPSSLTNLLKILATRVEEQDQEEDEEEEDGGIHDVYTFWKLWNVSIYNVTQSKDMHLAGLWLDIKAWR